MNREEFERLNLEEQERVFHKTPFREKGDLLLHSNDPVRLAQSLSREELYLLTREMDLEERSEVLRYASLPQLFFISDIDCWKKDRLHPKGFVQWLETLLEADEQRCLAWLVEMDYETIVSGFKGVMGVLKPEWEYPTDEVLGDQPYFTLDERYFISVKEENLETVRRAIEILFENHRGRYAVILEGILGELDYEMEEEAFQNRTRRLAERGFPDSETAHHIYRSLSREEFDKFPLKNGIKRLSHDSTSSDWKAPHYLTLWSQDRFFLDEVLLLFRSEPAEIREGLEEELAWLSNKVIASNGVDFASEERVRQGVERARRFVNIGLEALSGGNLDRAREMMKERQLELIFRWGVTQLVELRNQARQIVEIHWKGDQVSFLEFLEEPYEPIFRGLFREVPECFDPEAKGDPGPLRDFKDRQDLERTRRAVLQVERIHEFLAETFPNLFHRQASLFSLLGTVFVSFVQKGKASPQPLSQEDIHAFLKKGFEDAGSRRILKARSKEKFLNQFFSSPHQDLAKPLWALVFQRLEEELSSLDPSRAIDSRFVSSVSISEKGSR